MLDFVSDMWRFVVGRRIGTAQHQIGLVDDEQVIVGPRKRAGITDRVFVLIVIFANDQIVVDGIGTLHVDGVIRVLVVVIIIIYGGKKRDADDRCWIWFRGRIL